jgi:hypothetical protein
MPTSILEDSENLKKGGKSTLLLLFLLGLTILIYLATKLPAQVHTLKLTREEIVSSEFITSKPEELTFLIPPVSPPRTTVEREERLEKLVNSMNYWSSQLEETRNQLNKNPLFPSEVPAPNDPKQVIKTAVLSGLVHPREYQPLLKEAQYFNLTLTDEGTWASYNDGEDTNVIQANEIDDLE